LANFTQTITNSVRAFGGGPSTKWGQADFAYTMTWGTANWGEGLATTDTINSIPFSFVNVVGISITPDSTISESVNAFRTISNNLSPDTDITGESLQDGSLNWYYVFSGGTTNANSSAVASWASSSGSSIVYTSGSVSQITWSSL
jgi:hypothetical protein